MKKKSIFRSLAAALTLALMLVAIPAAPVMAASTVTVENNEPTSDYFGDEVGEEGDAVIIRGSGIQDQPYNIYFSSQYVDLDDSSDDLINTHVTVYDYVGAPIGNPANQVYITYHIPGELKDGPNPAEDEELHGGTYYVYVTFAGDTLIRDVGTFYITNVAGITDYSPDDGTVGTEVEISGQGMAPGENLIVEYDGDDISGDVDDAFADGDGEFTLTFDIPLSEYGEHTITITGEDSLAELEVTFTVIPEILLDPVIGEGGIYTTIIGTGFDGNKDVIIYFDGVEVKTKRADSNGSFDTVFLVPEGLDAGEYTVLAEDEDDDDIWDDAEFEIIIIIPPLNPDIGVTPLSGNVGDTITVSGTEFTPDDEVIIYFDGVSVGTAPTDGDGNFSGSFDIPASAAGSHIIKAEDTEDHSDTATVSVEPEIAIDIEEGPSGTEVTVTGTGFGDEADIEDVEFDNDNIDIDSGDEKTDEDGSFEFSFIVPAIESDTYTLEVMDEDNNKAEAEFTVLATSADISPATGAVGTEITVSGDNFVAGTTVTISYDDAVVATAAADSNGVVSVKFNAPASATGDHEVIISDGVNDVLASFAITASVTMNPTSGKVGAGVGMEGFGFGANKTISVLFNNTPVTLLAPVTTDDNGTFSNVQFYVPASPGGAAIITVSDGTINKTVNFTVEPSIIAIDKAIGTASPGHVGKEFTVSGDGYKAGATVEVIYASDPVLLASGEVEANGSFSIDFTIPVSEAGEHSITVNIDDVEIKEYTFIMESAAPSRPGLAAIYVGVKAEAPISFDWNEVSDASLPVTYVLQVFTLTGTTETVVIEKELDTTEYTLSEAEVLKLVPLEKGEYYYWHVQAVDSAGNVSSWSDTDTFTIASPGGGWPGWLTWLLVGLGAFFLFIFAIMLGRRIAYSSY